MQYFLTSFLLLSRLALSQTPQEPSALYLFPSGTNVPVNAKILARAACCVGSDPNIVLTDISGRAIPGVKSTALGEWAIFTPAEDLQPDREYRIQFVLAGRRLSTDTFRTGSSRESGELRLISSVPASGSLDVPITSPVTLRFSQPLDPSLLTNALPVFSTQVGKRWILTDPFQLVLEPGLLPFTYTRISSGATPLQSIYGQRLADPIDIAFSTYPAAPNTPLRLLASVPFEGETSVPTNAALSLKFERPLLNPLPANFRLTDGDGAPMDFTLESFPAEPTILALRPKLLLRPTQTHRIEFLNLRDVFGNPYEGAPSISFATAQLPESIEPRITAWPPAETPLVKELRWSANTKLNPLFLPRLFESPLSPYLSEDGFVLIAPISSPGRYLLSGTFRDRFAIRQIFGGQTTTTVTAEADTRAPALGYLFPAPGSAMGPQSLPGFQFDEAIDRTHPFVAELVAGDSVSPMQLLANENGYALQPSRRLEPGPTYRIRLRNVRDLAGNFAADQEWEFRVENPPTGDFRVESFSPAANSDDVPNDAVIEVNFNRPLNPACLWSATSGRVRSSVYAIPGAWTVESNTARFVASGPLPAGQISVDLSVCSDQFGKFNSSTTSRFSFWTRDNSPSGEAPRVLSVLPEPGSLVLPAGQTFSLAFDQPLDPASLERGIRLEGEAGSHAVYGLGSPILSPDGKRLDISLQSSNVSALNAKLYRLRITPSGLGMNGRPLEPRDFSWPVRETVPPLGAPELGFSVASFVNDPVDPNSTTRRFPLFRLHRPLDRDLVARAFQAIAVDPGNQKVEGALAWAEDGMSFSFVPKDPLPFGRTTFLISHAPWGLTSSDRLDLQVGFRFTQPFTSNVGHTLLAPVDTVVDIEFTTPRTVEQLGGLRLQRMNESASPIANVAFDATQLDARRIRIRPKQNLNPDSLHFVTFRLPENNFDHDIRFRTSKKASTPLPALSFGPTSTTGPVPPNAILWLQAPTYLNPVNLKVSLHTDTSPQTTTTLEVLVRDTAGTLLIRPLGLLKSNTRYNVAISGLEDFAGQKFPDRNWSFQTSGSSEFTPPRLLKISPSGMASPSTPLSMQFERPVLISAPPGSSIQLEPDTYTFINTELGPIPGKVAPSPDSRSLFITPSRPWPLFANISHQSAIPSVRTWTGQMWTHSELPQTSFFVTTQAPEPALVTAAAPLAGATNVPRNTRIGLRFSKQILAATEPAKLLSDSHEPIELQSIWSQDRRTVVFNWKGQLLPNTTYELAIPAWEDLDGLALTGPASWQFSTNEEFIDSEASYAYFFETDSGRFRIESSRPIHPLSLDPEVVRISDGNLTLETEWQFESGGKILYIRPRGPLTMQRPLNLTLPTLRDLSWSLLRFEAAPGFPNNSWLPGQEPDTTPPLPTFLHPELDATVPLNVTPTAMFAEQIFAPLQNTALKILANGKPVRGRISRSFQDPREIQVVPESAWRVGLTYEIEYSGIRDLAGNTIPPLQWRFTTRQTLPSDASALRLLSSSPAPNAVGVPPSATIQLDFDQPIRSGPQSFSQPLSYVRDQSSVDVPSLTTLHGTSLKAQPNTPLPGGVEVNYRFALIALSGFSQHYSSLRYYTAAPEDTEPPFVVDISPTPPATLRSQQPLRLYFNEPVVLSANPFRLTDESGERFVSISYPLAGNGRVIQLNFSSANSTSTLRLDMNGDRIRDVSGNAAASTSWTFESERESDSAIPRLDRPAPGERLFIGRNQTVQLIFSQRIVEDSLLAHLGVAVDGYAVTPQLNTSDGGRTWTLSLPGGWPASKLVHVSIPAGKVLGASGHYIAQRQAFTLVVGEQLSNSITPLQIRASQSAIEIKTAENLPGVLEEPFGLRSGQQRIPIRIERLGKRRLLLLPTEKLQDPTRYRLMLGTQEFPIQFAPDSSLPKLHPRRVVEWNPSPSTDRLTLEFGNTDPFDIDWETLEALDTTGQPVDVDVRYDPESNALIVEGDNAKLVNCARLRIR